MPNEIIVANPDFRPDGSFAPGNSVAARPRNGLLRRLKRMANEEIDDVRLRGILDGVVNEATAGNVQAFAVLVGKKAAEEGILNDETSEMAAKVRRVVIELAGQPVGNG